MDYGLMTLVVFCVVVASFIIGINLRNARAAWLDEYHARTVRQLKAEIHDLQSKERTNREYSELIKAIILQYGTVDNPEQWKGYNYEAVTLLVKNMELLPASAWNHFEASGQCYRMHDDVRVQPPKNLVLKATREKKP